MKTATGPSVVLSGIGIHKPERVMTNEDMSKIVDTSDEWIRARTGITERRIAAKDEQVSDMAVSAARKALEQAGLQPEDIGMIVVCTMSPEKMSPATACLVQAKLGCPPVMAFDVSAACSGFIYGVEVCMRMLKGGACKHALLIGAEKMSSIMDWEDRTTCVLFGDAAGAIVMSLSDEPETGFLGGCLKADGSQVEILHVPSGGSARPASHETVDAREHYLRMTGKEVFKLAVREMEAAVRNLLKERGLTLDDVAYVIAHQANSRIIDMMTSRLGVPKERVPMNLDKYGNTSAASIPLVLEEVVSNGNLKKGDLLVLVAFGAGLTWGASLLKWQG